MTEDNKSIWTCFLIRATFVFLGCQKMAWKFKIQCSSWQFRMKFWSGTAMMIKWGSAVSICTFWHLGAIYEQKLIILLNCHCILVVNSWHVNNYENGYRIGIRVIKLAKSRIFSEGGAFFEHNLITNFFFALLLC